ncbi:MAG: transketolase [Planctomycetota bacterium]|nr:transketolase [Planctomycetota bacterium]
MGAPVRPDFGTEHASLWNHRACGLLGHAACSKGRSMSFEAAVHAQAIELDRLCLEMCAAAGSGHPTTAMSLGHIVTVLLFDAMRWSPESPAYPTSDRLVLSSGHAVPIVYSACAKLGTMVGKDPSAMRELKLDDLKSLRAKDSVLDGHPNPMEGFPFFDAATGSLGQGLSVAAGLAEAARLDKLDKKIYCIVGDGESREGQIFEAVDFIAERKLRNVCLIVNCNEYGQADRVSPQQSAEALAVKLASFGLETRIIDGHNPTQIRAAFEAFQAASQNPQAKPLAIIAKTMKGWGCPSIQGNGWHGKPPTGESLKKALAELDERRVEVTSSLASGGEQFQIDVPPETLPPEPKVRELEPMTAVMKSMDMESLVQAGNLATRRAYGIALRALCRANERVVVLDADVSNSTFAEYVKKDPAISDRFIECKIAEQNMVSVAAGLAAAGKIPFLSSFAKFITRAYDQIEMAINSGANIKIVGSHSGITLASDGPSQMALPDVAWFRSFTTMRDHRGNPGCYILQPADAFAAFALTEVMAEYEGVCYMRTLRPETEFIYSDDIVFNLGGFEVLNEGRDIVLCAAGYMVHEANKAVDLLDKAGISATLVDLYSLPFDEPALLDIIGANNFNVITIEDNYGGGIGSAVADALTTSGDACKIRQLHVKRIPKSTRTIDEQMVMHGLNAPAIVKAVNEMLGV